MLWIFHDCGSQSLYVIGERTSVIVDGPSHLAANLRFGRECFRCCPSNHTLDPFSNGWKFHQVLLFMVCLARS